MSLESFSANSGKSMLSTCLATVFVIGAFVWLTQGPPAAPHAEAAQPSKPKGDLKHEHDAADHDAETAALKLAFSGASIDLYFEPNELETGKPGLTGLKFLEHVDVTGKELLRFEKGGGESWLIDPDTVFAFRARKSK